MKRQFGKSVPGTFRDTMLRAGQSEDRKARPISQEARLNSDSAFSDKKTVLERVFSDACVIDVDFSEWDQRITLVVLADHLPFVNGRLPIIEVWFERVKSLRFSFSQYELQVPELENPENHIAWRIDDFEVALKPDGGIQVALFERSTMPRIDLVCGSIQIHKMDHSVLDDLFPGWDRPWAALARPGLRTMAATREETNN